MRRPANIGPVPPPEKDRDQAPAVVRVRLWPEEYHRVCAKAREAGLPVKEWALRVLVGAVSGRSVLPEPDGLDLACSGFVVEPSEAAPAMVLLTFKSPNPRTWMLNKDDARAVALAILAQTGLK